MRQDSCAAVSRRSRQTPEIKVSVAIISYNHAAFIAQAIESAAGQQLNCAFEIVIADDCSSDATPEIIRAFQRRYPNLIRVLERKHNLGASRNTYATLAACRGAY